MTVTLVAEAYSKLFSSITRSSIWGEDDQTLRVWITMLALADRDGYVGASLRGLAAQARVPVEKTSDALDKFMSPDPDSRSTEHEGRRVAIADRGWTILNYARFRDMRDEEQKRAADRKRQRDHRARVRAEKPDADPPPEPPNDFDGSPNETTCPLDLAEQAEKILPELARKLRGANIPDLRASAERCVTYYTIGRGMGQRRRFWMKVLRGWIAKDHGENKLKREDRPRNASAALRERADRLKREAEERERGKAAE